MEDYMVTFPNTHSAIMGEQSLLTQRVPSSVMPMPPSISGGCDICLRIKGDHRAHAASILRTAGVSVDGWYRIDRANTVSRFSRVEIDQ